MASAQSEDHTGHLSLSLDTINSSSPFPSPGSAFLPPPVPRPHEFAMRPVSAGRKMSQKDGEDVGIGSRQSDVHAPHNGNTNGTAAANANVGDPATDSGNPPNGVETVMRAFADNPSMLGSSGHRTPTPLSPTPTSTPHTPTELTYARAIGGADETEQQGQTHSQAYPNGGSEPSLFLPSPSTQCSPNHRLSTQSVTSLTSSRPAPPSPVMSRRASGMSRASSSVRSRPVSGVSGSASRPVSGNPISQPASGVRSRPVSGSLGHSSTGLSRTPSGRRAKELLGMSSVTESKEQAQTAEEKSAQVKMETLIIIRDYAFKESDPRYSGEGISAPHENRPKVLARQLGYKSSSTSSLLNPEELEEDDDSYSGMNEWGGFQWGFARLQHGWNVGARGSISGPDAEFPSQTDFERNFADAGEEEEEDDEAEAYDDAEDFTGDEPEGEPELFPGLYRALYAFEPEGTAEMKLDEEQIVRVVGRGGGVGWAVVVKDGLVDNGVHALVPESYLEAVRLDGDEEDA
ncbi:hypothetical protein F5I97DRAFT_980206 [Phlebopus sp. FC_14]|nr:hypothetical protein F5I97DRAFT_469181 [Phlebopus sp. FC_14]KAH7888284.1 hypothetical protein F5I97DRAFT_980206 [Phlebopus sp. FC_14]